MAGTPYVFMFCISKDDARVSYRINDQVRSHPAVRFGKHFEGRRAYRTELMVTFELLAYLNLLTRLLVEMLHE